MDFNVSFQVLLNSEQKRRGSNHRPSDFEIQKPVIYSESKLWCVWDINPPPSPVIRHCVTFDPDLYSHILRLRGSHLSPGRLLVVVHLVAHWLLPVDGFGLEGEIKRMGVKGGGRRGEILKLVLTNKLYKLFLHPLQLPGEETKWNINLEDVAPPKDLIPLLPHYPALIIKTHTYIHTHIYKHTLHHCPFTLKAICTNIRINLRSHINSQWSNFAFKSIQATILVSKFLFK